VFFFPVRDGSWRADAATNTRSGYLPPGLRYIDHLNADRLTRYHTKRLAALGYTVTLAKHAT
jgi:hypothetical protein